MGDHYTDAETGFVYLRARYYDPGTGQFLTRDPIEAQTRVAYGYAGGNPLSNVDPNGMNWLSDKVSGAGRAVAHHWRGIAQAAVDTVVLAGSAFCVAATDGLCLAALPAIGAVNGSVNFLLSGEPITALGLGRAAAGARLPGS